jgi:hypothetical protein
MTQLRDLNSSSISCLTLAQAAVKMQPNQLPQLLLQMKLRQGGFVSKSCVNSLPPGAKSGLVVWLIGCANRSTCFVVYRPSDDVRAFRRPRILWVWYYERLTVCSTLAPYNVSREDTTCRCIFAVAYGRQ